MFSKPIMFVPAAPAESGKTSLSGTSKPRHYRTGYSVHLMGLLHDESRHLMSSTNMVTTRSQKQSLPPCNSLHSREEDKTSDQSAAVFDISEGTNCLAEMSNKSISQVLRTSQQSLHTQPTHYVRYRAMRTS